MKYPFFLTLSLLFKVSLLAAQNIEPMTLSECIDKAFSQNLNLLQSSQNIEEAALQIKQAYSSFYPAVNATAYGNMVNNNPESSLMPNPVKSTDFSLGLSQNLYAPGLFLAPKAASISQNVQNLNQENIKAAVQQAVEENYYTILSSTLLIKVYEENIRLNDENIKKVETMVQLGISKESDILKYEVQRGQSEYNLIMEAQSIKARKRALNILMGEKPDSPLELQPIDEAEIKIPDYQQALDAIQAKNPVIRRLQQQKALQNINLKSAQQSYFPTVSASLGQSWDSRNGTQSNAFSMNLQASLPIFTGFKRSHTIQQERVRLKSAELALEAELAQYEEALLNLYSNYRTAERLMGIQEKILENASKDLELINQRYAIGSSTILDQMDAQITVLSSQTDLVKTRYNKMILVSKIRQITGIE
jgi:outer membrane protein